MKIKAKQKPCLILELVDAEEEVVPEVKPEVITAEADVSLEAPKDVAEEVSFDISAPVDITLETKEGTEDTEAEFQVSVFLHLLLV